MAFLWVILCGVLSLPARSADLSLADSDGSGGASAGDTRATGILLESPATLTLEPRYDAQAGARLGGTDDLTWAIEARDSRTGPVTLALAYVHRSANPPPSDADLPGWRLPDEDLENPIAETTLAVDLGGGFLDDRLGVAASAVRYTRETAFTGLSDTYDAGIGVGGRPVEPLTLALGAVNLVDLFEKGDTFHPLTATLGAGARSDVASVSAQIQANLHDVSTSVPLAWRVGGEVDLVDGKLPLRLGFRHELGVPTTYLCAGIGASTDVASLDYAIVQDLGRDGGAKDLTGARTWHSLSVRILIPAGDEAQ